MHLALTPACRDASQLVQLAPYPGDSVLGFFVRTPGRVGRGLRVCSTALGPIDPRPDGDQLTLERGELFAGGLDVGRGAREHTVRTLVRRPSRRRVALGLLQRTREPFALGLAGPRRFLLRLCCGPLRRRARCGRGRPTLLLRRLALLM